MKHMISLRNKQNFIYQTYIFKTHIKRIMSQQFKTWKYNGPSGSRLNLNPENTGDRHHQKYGSCKNEM